MKTTIGIDIDDTLAVHFPEIIAYSNQYYGTNLTLETYNEDWASFWNVDKNEVERRAQIFHDEAVSHFKKISDAHDVLTHLAQKHKLVIVTARPQYLIDVSKKWIDEHFNGLFEEIHFVPMWEFDNTLTKADLCIQIGVDYLVDDIPRHCNAAAEVGVKAILFGDYVWRDNEELHHGVTRIKSWKAAEEYFDVQSR